MVREIFTHVDDVEAPCEEEEEGKGALACLGAWDDVPPSITGAHHMKLTPKVQDETHLEIVVGEEEHGRRIDEEHTQVAASQQPPPPHDEDQGGTIGFDKVLWDTDVMVDKVDGSQYVQFTYHSFDGEEGFPGNVKVQVAYRLTRDMELLVDMRAIVGNKSTPLNLAQHTYWNLGGHNSGTILNNSIQIAGDKITLVDGELIPTGQLEEVAGTPYDFRRQRVIGSQIDKVTGGYDINYELKGGHTMRIMGGKDVHFAAKVRDPKSRRAMEVYTNQVGMQFYTSNGLSGVVGKGGAMYGMHDALCLETQGFPDAVHHPNFPSVIVPAHHHYHHIMLFRFSLH
ncbi:hypothetical protein L7F22_020353 [Adiantum nelumboides]|nr:hypothetical protein [Adiantum nelumboides]